VMNPNPLSSLNHLTVPVAMLSQSSDVPLRRPRPALTARNLHKSPTRGGRRPVNGEAWAESGRAPAAAKLAPWLA